MIDVKYTCTYAPVIEQTLAKEDVKHVTRIPCINRARRSVHCEEHNGGVENEGKPSGRRCERRSAISAQDSGLVIKRHLLKIIE